jgi:hypothetical protein
MYDTGRIVLGIVFLVLVFLLTRRYHAWKMKQTYASIIRDLRQQGATAPSSAVSLPYAQMRYFRIGLRDYRPRILAYMVSGQVVGRTEENRYYLLKEDVMPDNQ